MKVVIPSMGIRQFGKKLNEKLQYDLIQTMPSDTKVCVYEERDKTWQEIIAREVHGEDCFIFDDDVSVKDKDWYSKFVRYKEETKYDVIGFKLLFPNNVIQHYGGFIRSDGLCGHSFINYFNYGLDQPLEAPYVTFSVIYIPAYVLAKVPSIADYYLTREGSYFEDADFCFRAREQGFKVGVIPVEFYHLESFTKKLDAESNPKAKRNLGIFSFNWMQKILNQANKD